MQTGLDYLVRGEEKSTAANKPDITIEEVVQVIKMLKGLEEKFNIAMSANAFTEDVSKAYGAGMDDYITKPMSLQEIKIVLQSIKEQEQRLAQ